MSETTTHQQKDHQDDEQEAAYASPLPHSNRHGIHKIRRAEGSSKTMTRSNIPDFSSDLLQPTIFRRRARRPTACGFRHQMSHHAD